MNATQIARPAPLATRAGLTGYMHTGYNPDSGDSRRGDARYIRLRFGPEYTDDVTRLQVSRPQVAATMAQPEAAGE